MNRISKIQFISGALWKMIEEVSSKGISFIVSVILARLIAPADYGLIAVTAIFTNFSDILIDGGFSTALIRKESVDEYDYSCVMIASMAIAIILYGVIFGISPFVADYYGEPALKLILRVIGLVLFIQAFSSARNAVIHRSMRFKLLFYCNMAGSLFSGIFGIIAAYQGMGVWALVIQQLSQNVIVTFLIFINLHWKFCWKFRLGRFKEILHFSIGVLSASFLNYIGSALYNLIIGKRYSLTDLGYSEKGTQLPMQASLYTFSAISSVLLPTLSSYQDDIVCFKRILRKVIHMTAFLIFPIMVGMMTVSKELIVVLLTSKWLPAVMIMKFSCIYYMATPFMLINIQVFYALGHSFLRVKTEIIRLGMLVLSLIIFCFIFQCDINQLAFINAMIAVLISIITFMEIRKLVSYSLKEVLEDIEKPFLCSGIMGIAIIFFNLIIEGINIYSYLFALIAKVIFGFFIYLIITVVWKVNALEDIMQNLKIFRK